MKRLASLFPLTTLCALNAAAICPDPADHAMQDAPSRRLYDCQLEEKEQTVSTCPSMEVFPDAGPRTCEGSGVFATASFIYWTPRQDGLEYAISGVGINPGQGKVHSVDFDMEPGFKVGLGYGFEHDGWDILAQFTWLHGDADDSTGMMDISAIANPQNNTILSSSANWNLKYQVVDTELGRNFFVSRFLKIRPFAGFKGNWQSQDYVVRYLVDDIVEIEAKTRIDQDFWGFGIRGGCNTAWHFTNAWSFFGNFALSGLWSGYNVKRLDINEIATVNNVILNTKDSFHTISPVLELLVGFRFETWFLNDTYHIAVDAGWEEQVWWGHNRYVRINDVQTNGGNLSFQGLTLTFRFDF